MFDDRLTMLGRRVADVDAALRPKTLDEFAERAEVISTGGSALPVGNPGDLGYPPDMAQLAVTIPPALQNWVDTRLAEGDYADAGDYVRDLVRRDRDLVEQDARFLRVMVEEGLASGIVDAEPEDVLREIMARLPDA